MKNTHTEPYRREVLHKGLREINLWTSTQIENNERCITDILSALKMMVKRLEANVVAAGKAARQQPTSSSTTQGVLPSSQD
jgi:hypothetical protein